MEKVVIIGATSLIAQNVARLYAGAHAGMVIVGRNQQHLHEIAADLSVRGAEKVDVIAQDLTVFDTHEELLSRADEFLAGIDTVFIAHGSLPLQKTCEQSAVETLKALELNVLSYISLLILFANYFEKRQSGCIACVSSVAGDRGRQSNYIYGTAKGALSIFMQGLRNRLSSSGVAVVTIKPGFVDTPMTKDFKKGLLWVGPDKVARDIYKAIHMRRDVVYTPWFWKWIMLVIKLIPERFFKKMHL